MTRAGWSHLPPSQVSIIVMWNCLTHNWIMPMTNMACVQLCSHKLQSCLLYSTVFLSFLLYIFVSNYYRKDSKVETMETALEELKMQLKQQMRSNISCIFYYNKLNFQAGIQKILKIVFFNGIYSIHIFISVPAVEKINYWLVESRIIWQ